MKISTKGRYAIRMMIDLATYGNESLVRMKDMAHRQEISIKYMEHIISMLVGAGYVQGVRGPQGGYRLAKRPEECVIGDILRLTEGGMAPVECLEGSENHCARKDVCATLQLWKELDLAIKGVIDNYTVADLIERNKLPGAV